MPRYVFENTDTKEDEVHWLSINELDLFKETNPSLKQKLSVSAIADPTRLGIQKPEAGFRDVLKRVKSHHYKSNINTW
jgi:hypothetical protein